MKILVFSDSHRSRSGMYTAIETLKPDQVIHLGDLVEDAEDVSFAFPELPFCIVSGNCDGWSGGAEEREFTLDGVKCYLTHGHLQHVKMGLWGLVKAGTDRGADAVFFGHTHLPMAERQENGLWLINPGTIGGVHNRATYAVVEIENGSLSVEIRALDDD